MLMATKLAAPLGGLLYSLLHLGGFDGDLSFYASRSTGRVLEMGCGDGRIAAALCLGTSPLSTLQEQQQAAAAGFDTPSTRAAAASPPHSYSAIEICEPLALKARARLADAPCEVDILVGDFLTPLPPERIACFDTVLVSANTLFTTARHDALLANCAAALSPGGVLLLDVYNALLWHGDDEEQEEAQAAQEEVNERGEEATVLVRVQDEEGRDWTVYERDPAVDSNGQTIRCVYDFHTSATAALPDDGSRGDGGDGGGSAVGEGAMAAKVMTETLVHEYLLPEQLVRKLDACGFVIDEIFGSFDEALPFDPDESEHVVVVARRRADST